MKPTILIIGATGSEVGYLMEVLSTLQSVRDQGTHIIDFQDEKLINEPITFPIRNYRLDYLTEPFFLEESRIKQRLWFQGSENVKIRIPGKKQNDKYNQRRKLRNNKHKK